MRDDHPVAAYQDSYNHFLKLATWGSMASAAVVALVVLIIS